jgi:hypothetical protein
MFNTVASVVVERLHPASVTQYQYYHGQRLSSFSLGMGDADEMRCDEIYDANKMGWFRWDGMRDGMADGMGCDGMELEGRRDGRGTTSPPHAWDHCIGYS